MEKPIKLYIDTSVWNFALEVERADSALTNEFLQMVKSENYIVVISDVVLAEIDDALEPRKSQLKRLLNLLNFKTIAVNDEAKNLAGIYIKEELMSQKESNDAQHIAVATINNCDFIVSWNFKHMVKAKVIMGVHHINHKNGYNLIEIVSPQQFLGKKE